MNYFVKQLSNEEAMFALATALAKNIEQGTIIFLEGPLGAGKTTFARGFLRALGFNEKVKSPTYTLVESYQISGLVIFHFDFYRLLDVRELEQIGIHDYFSETAICLIEWAEKGKGVLPQPDLICYIDFLNDGREIKIEANTSRGKKLIAGI